MTETEVVTTPQTTKTATKRVRKTTGAKKTVTKKTASASGTTKKRVRRVKKTTANETVAPAVEETVAPVETETETATATATETATEETTQLNEHVGTVNTVFEQINTQLDELVKTIHTSGFGQRELRAVVKSYRNTSKVLQRVHEELFSLSLKRADDFQRLLNKRTRKHKGRSNPNSGIQKMHEAHPLLATFMGVEEGSPVSRVQALKAISAYVREHDLQVPSNRRTFYCKGDLHNLFPNSETMGYTDIMREIKPFFPSKQQ
jgi:chromatin remodeling complex protein RSC6